MQHHMTCTRAPHTLRARRGGHTLLELVTVIAVAGVIAGVIAPPLAQGLRLQNSATVRGALLQEGRSALERLTRELRETPYDAAATDAPAITLADATAIDCQDQSYRLTGTTLERCAAGASTWYPLAKHVSAATFSYYDQDGNALAATPLSAANRALIRRIGVDVTLAQGGQTLRLRSGVFLRYFAFRGM
jgi:type II secretory pathway pseudopilin PulG